MKSMIRVTKSSMVRPMAKAKANATLWLSNMDLLMYDNHHQTTIYFFRYNGAPDFFDPALLKAALSRTLVAFYPMAGRYRRTTDRIEIECNDEGVLFVEAEADCDLDDLGGNFWPRPDFNFLPSLDYSQDISSWPLSIFQLTRFKCGSVCLGVGNDHMLADGATGLHFINTWSDIARGMDITFPPFFDKKAVLCARCPPNPTFPHTEYQSPPSLLKEQEQTTFSTFTLTGDQVQALKNKCTNNGDIFSFSTFEVLAAHLWRCITIARGLPKYQQTKLRVPVDGRSRLRPPLPKGYLGNVIFHANPSALAGDLVANPLRFAARIIKEALGRVDDEYMRSAIDYLETKNDKSSCLCSYDNPNLSVNGWVKLPFYHADFGWGKPIHVGPARVPPAGLTFIMPSPVNDASIVYAISIPKTQLELFRHIIYEI